MIVQSSDSMNPWKRAYYGYMFPILGLGGHTATFVNLKWLMLQSIDKLRLRTIEEDD